MWTLGPTPPEADSFPNADKVFHALAYAVMVLLLSLAADRRPGRGAGRFPGSATRLAVLAVVAGGALELLQHLTGRDTQLLDWVADGVGAAIGLWGWALINRRWTAGYQALVWGQIDDDLGPTAHRLPISARSSVGDTS